MPTHLVLQAILDIYINFLDAAAAVKLEYVMCWGVVGNIM